MKTKNIYLLLVFAACYFLSGKAQIVNYTYDAAGNRVNRIITLPTKSSEDQIDIYDARQDSLVKNFNSTQTFNDAIKETKITIFPNPTRGQMVVQIANQQESTHSKITIFDLSGKIIFTQQNIKGYNNVDITSATRGTYIMKIMIGDQTSQWKVIKE